MVWTSKVSFQQLQPAPPQHQASQGHRCGLAQWHWGDCPLPFTKGGGLLNQKSKAPFVMLRSSCNAEPWWFLATSIFPCPSGRAPVLIFAASLCSGSRLSRPSCGFQASTDALRQEVDLDLKCGPPHPSYSSQIHHQLREHPWNIQEIAHDCTSSPSQRWWAMSSSHTWLGTKTLTASHWGSADHLQTETRHHTAGSSLSKGGQGWHHGTDI